jgi:hypothetical protein
MQRQLESAFRRTNYRVFARDGELLLKVDEANPGLAALLHASGAACAALLTAFNPGGSRQALFRNRRSQQRLHHALQQWGYPVIQARNEDPRSLWPGEPSLLVPGLACEVARQLAADHGQIAFLWIEAGGTPRLIETAARPG